MMEFFGENLRRKEYPKRKEIEAILKSCPELQGRTVEKAVSWLQSKMHLKKPKTQNVSKRRKK